MQHLAKCVQVIEAMLANQSLVWENDDVSDALTAAGIIYWDTVPKSGEVDAHFEGSEDLEPGDTYWTTTKAWADIVAASKVKEPAA